MDGTVGTSVGRGSALQLWGVLLLVLDPWADPPDTDVVGWNRPCGVADTDVVGWNRLNWAEIVWITVVTGVVQCPREQNRVLFLICERIWGFFRIPNPLGLVKLLFP